MKRDTHLRIIFIPLLGICLPLISGIVTYRLYSPVELIFINLFFILVSLVIWTGSNWMHTKLRLLFAPLSNPFSKIATMSFAEGLYGACVGGIAAFCWFEVSREIFQWSGFTKFILLSILAVVIFTLIYEILFLSREREIDSQIVKQLDEERLQAELQALSTELDPHFLFNSLNTLNYLINTNPEQAYNFNNKLAQVYKYMLINKAKRLITLEEELEFINNYFFLLQIRHDNKLQMQSELGDNYKAVLLPPCALQILLENAIKHNEFTDAHPLLIRITMNGKFLYISNNSKPKMYAVNSTGIGLKNLSSRYKIICQKDIVIENTRENYTVKLPLIRKLINT